METYRRFAQWLFSVPDGSRSRWDIIRWWEIRRIPYNVIVGLAGVFSMFLLYFFIADEPIVNGEDIGEPILIFIAPFLINICYTAGWIVEAFFPGAFLESFMVERKQIGPRFLRNGLQLSLIVVFLPTVVWGVLWALRLAGLRK